MKDAQKDHVLADRQLPQSVASRDVRRSGALDRESGWDSAPQREYLRMRDRLAALINHSSENRA
jgi:hypothetical protein